MTDDELCAALDAVIGSPPCGSCDAVVQLLIHHPPDGCVLVFPMLIHDDDCNAA